MVVNAIYMPPALRYRLSKKSDGLGLIVERGCQGFDMFFVGSVCELELESIIRREWTGTHSRISKPSER